MPYTQVPPRYDAHQWTGGTMTVAQFSAIVDPQGSVNWSVNQDGSLHFQKPFIITGDIPLGAWVVSLPYWTTSPPPWDFLSTTTVGPNGMYFTDADFLAQFALAS